LPPFQLLVDAHAAELHRFLAGFLGPDDAEDCLQETLISALRAYPRLRNGDNLRAWLYTIARRKATDVSRWRMRRPSSALDSIAPSAEPAEEPMPIPDDGLWSRVRGLPEVRAGPGLPVHRRADGHQRGGSSTERGRGPAAAAKGDKPMNELERCLANPGEPPFDRDRLLERLRARASAEGLLDVAYAELDSPLGRLLVAVTPRGLVRIAYQDEDAVLDELSRALSPRLLRAPERTDQVRRELDAYFAGERRTFDLALDWSLIRGFAQKVLRATARVPFGQVTTYGSVAAEAGSPRAARAAGNALGSNPIPIVVPCHRVLHAGGGLGGYAGGLDRKRYLLELEGTPPPRRR